MSFQAPKGTRDFYPEDMARRQHLIDAWRRVSERHGFEQVDGPIFESLELYKAKSGEGIVSELFHFEDRGGRALAIRPEFTPTLARMAAARANALPRPIKWFATSNFCRAERPQRGRLREFWQWNVDLLGLDDPLADAEVIAVAVGLLQELGLTSQQVRVRLSHREAIGRVLVRLGVAEDDLIRAFDLLDQRDKLPAEEFARRGAELGLDESKVERLNQMCRRRFPAGDVDHLARAIGMDEGLEDLEALDRRLADFGLTDWCEYDLGIVRGLAYYTGLVFELHEVSGAERALAGGGRYDKLVEQLGGPKLPAVGFGMGDVVLALVLEDKGAAPERFGPRPDVFILAADDASAERAPAVASALRGKGVHARFSYKSTRNVGKLMRDAEKAHARFALVLGSAEDALKDLATGDQHTWPAPGDATDPMDAARLEDLVVRVR
ncbi:MAG: histidine--tRNA ligase [Planctomycetota bacterium]